MTVIFDSIRAGHPLNPTHAFWRQLLDVGFPFVKRDLMARDPSGMSDHTEILETLSKMSSQELLEMMLEDLKRRGSNRVQSLNA
jgi:DNA-binding GntR family transcriptional regulator